MKKLLISMLSILFIIQIVNAGTFISCETYGNCKTNPSINSQSVNYSSVNVNNSQYLQGFTPIQVANLFTESDPIWISASSNYYTSSYVNSNFCYANGTNISGSLCIPNNNTMFNITYDSMVNDINENRSNWFENYTNVCLLNQSNNFNGKSIINVSNITYPGDSEKILYLYNGILSPSPSLKYNPLYDSFEKNTITASTANVTNDGTCSMYFMANYLSGENSSINQRSNSLINTFMNNYLYNTGSNITVDNSNSNYLSNYMSSTYEKIFLRKANANTLINYLNGVNASINVINAFSVVQSNSNFINSYLFGDRSNITVGSSNANIIFSYLYGVYSKIYLYRSNSNKIFSYLDKNEFIQTSLSNGNSIFGTNVTMDRSNYNLINGIHINVTLSNNSIIVGKNLTALRLMNSFVFGDNKITFLLNSSSTVINNQMYINDNTSIYSTDNTYIITNRSGGNNLLWVSNNISASGYITRTSIYDKSQGNALDFIKDSNDYLKTDSKGNVEIDHTKFYGYTNYQVTDFSKPVEKEIQYEECNNLYDENATILKDKNGYDLKECRNLTKKEVEYPYTKTEEGVSLDKEVDVLRQAVFELKNQISELLNKNNYLQNQLDKIKDCTKSEDYKQYSECVLKQ